GGGTPAALGLTASTNNLATVDGTQDAQIIVTVLDANGVPISNNVPVTLTITSGPGEFPTGTNITFLPPSGNPQSDISILNGQAAIEFRTYSSGTTVITATSPGLLSTNIVITSEGAPAFVPGVSPTAGSTPYSRYTGTNSTASTLTLALNRPTGASSTGGGLSSYGNDGSVNSIWQAAGTDSNAWWQVSLEANYAVNLVDLTFPTNANYAYTISVSSDGNTWTTVVDQSQNSNTDLERRAVGNFGSDISWVRINFTNLPPGLVPALAEVSVGGAPTLAFKTNQLGGTIIGTPGSYNNSGNTREMAMDWDLTTFFDAPSSTGGSNCWVGLDLGAGISKVITQINYCPRSNIPSRMVGGIFQGANQPDFSDAVALFTVATAPATNVLTAQFIGNATPFRYVRYLSPPNGWGNIAEVEFYSVTTAPGAPTNLTASAGNAQVALAWSASAGATGYNVKRSLTSGGGYTTVANLASTGFVDAGLANGTAYYYVVSATNAYGESVNSPEAVARPDGSYSTNFFWTGAVSTNWDTAAANWRTNGLPAIFQDGGAVVFDDTALSNTAVCLSAPRAPASVTVNNSTLTYAISGSAITGSGSLTKSGPGTLALNGANTFSGGVTNSGGTLTLGNAGALGTGTVTLNGGILNNSGAYPLTNNLNINGNGNAIQLGSANNFTLSGTIFGNGNLILGNDGNTMSLYLAGPNLMTGGTITVANNNNFVRFGTNVAGNAAVEWIFNNTAAGHTTFDFGSGTIYFGSLSGNGRIQGNVSGANSMNVTVS
ncbi:MAG TPA: discoidin domain-containing protein, partial [Verrucomicrobiae bacterium]|nr:discoidin domain-containing protein [Verrucomicrobiae bacterium]